MEGGGTAARRVAALATRIHWYQDRPIVTPGAGFPRGSSILDQVSVVLRPSVHFERQVFNTRETGSSKSF